MGLVDGVKNVDEFIRNQFGGPKKVNIVEIEKEKVLEKQPSTSVIPKENNPGDLEFVPEGEGIPGRKTMLELEAITKMMEIFQRSRSVSQLQSYERLIDMLQKL